MEQFISDKQEEIPYQKVSKTAEENTEKYYYRQLPEEQKQVYREILEGVRNHTEEIYVHDTDADETNQIFQKLMKDQPDIFGPLPEGRHLDQQRIDPVIKILPETALADQSRQFLIRGGDHPGVHAV